MSPAQNTNIPLVLVGNSLSVLIAATVRAEKGLKTVIVNPGGHLGGYFAGIQALGRLQDAGMVLYELSSLRHDASTPWEETTSDDFPKSFAGTSALCTTSIRYPNP